MISKTLLELMGFSVASLLQLEKKYSYVQKKTAMSVGFGGHHVI